MTSKEFMFVLAIISPIVGLTLISNWQCETNIKRRTIIKNQCFPISDESYKLATGKIPDLPTSTSSTSPGPNLSATFTGESIATTTTLPPFVS